MKVMFVDILHLFWDQHGVYSLSAFMKKHDIEVYFTSSRSLQKNLDAVRYIKPDLLLYSAFSSTVQEYINFDKKVKNVMDVRSLIGGPGPTFSQKGIEESTIDAICIGEGEFAIVDYINNGYKSIKNIYNCGDPSPTDFANLVELNDLPFPDRSVIYDSDSLLNNVPHKQFLSGRGCPYQCTYCFNHKFNQMFKDCGPTIRKKSVDYLIDEVKYVASKHPLHTVIFNDDTFILNKKWLFEFCERFPREVGISYTCNIRAGLVNNEVAEALAASGCLNVNWSIESGDHELRNKVLKRKMSDKSILETAHLLRKHNIPFRIGNIIGLPGESREQMKKTVELNISARPALGLANIFVPYPGVELTEYSIKHGYLSEDSIFDLPKDYFTGSILNFSKEDNNRIYKFMCLFPWFISYPFLYNVASIKNILLNLPRFILRLFYEFIYTMKMAQFYSYKTPFHLKCLMAIRYLRNI